MNATRLYTLKYGQNKQVLSIGRVQTPTLALIVNRQKEIDAFKPEPYFEIKTIYRETTFSAASGRFFFKIVVTRQRRATDQTMARMGSLFDGLVLHFYFYPSVQ
jgi:DNA topoisomerase IA